MKNYIKLMRIHHYIKNLLIFAALICSGQLFTAQKLLPACLGFLAFCFLSSSIYIINDIRDREKDRLHPTKCKRPIAAGKVPVKSARIFAACLFVAACICNAFIYNLSASLLLLLYFLLNLAYSIKLKTVPLLDVTILVSGFFLRVLYGAQITDIKISAWLYLTVLTLAFYFSFGKRRNELKQLSQKDGETREVLKSYSLPFLDKNMYMCLTLSNVFYALWTMSKSTPNSTNDARLIYTVPLVLLITMRYSMKIEGDSDGDPVEVLLHDKPLLLLCLLYGICMFCLLYF